MDDSRAFAEREIDQDFPVADEPLMEEPPAFGTDERRMHVRAYNYWVSLLAGRSFPSVEDIDPASIGDFGPHSVLFDFSHGPENPAIPYLGRALREEGGMDETIRSMNAVPTRSLLSRLTEHCLEIVANRAPVGFEAEYQNLRGSTTMYRGILMPFSSDDDTIDFIYGVINWKEVAEVDPGDDVRDAIGSALAGQPPVAPAVPVWADGPNAAPFAPQGYDNEEEKHGLDSSAGLHDYLAVARETAQALQDVDARSRAALYRVLGRAHDFALAIADEPQAYAEMLADAGLKAQARAPMMPVAKLIFGTDYDKTRLTEYAAVLAHALRIGIAKGALRDYLKNYEGGLKAIVTAERAARRPASIDKDGAALASLRTAPAITSIDLDTGGAEFVTLIGRARQNGGVEILSVAVLEKANLARTVRSFR